MNEETQPQRDGARLYAEERARRWADPEYRAIYDEEGARQALWLQLAEARQAAGLTQAQVAKRLGISEAQVARIEKRAYDVCTPRRLQQYLQALCGGHTLEVIIRARSAEHEAPWVAAVR